MRTLAVCAVLAIPAYATGAVAQQELQPELRFGEPFSNVMGVRELSDSEVLVSDRLEKAVYLLDLSRDSYRMIGSNGQGPREYEMPGRILPLPGDSSLLVDFGNRRVATMDRRGNIATTSPIMRGAGMLVTPEGVDASGNIYWDAAGTIMNVGGQLTGAGEEAPVMRMDRASEHIDTVATIAQINPSGAMRGSGGSGGSVSFSVSRGSGTAFEQRQDGWVVFPDGRIVIVRKDEYRLDMVTPDGHLITGSPVQYDPIPIRRADKEAWADDQANNTMTMVSIGGSGGGSRTIRGERPDISEVEFPEYFPAFQTSRVWAGPRGETWVQRYQSYSEARPLFDVFDADGRRVRQVRLLEGRRIVGFGESSLYTVHADDDDLQWLERYDLSN